MKKILSFLLAVVLVLSFSLVATTPVAAATLTVNTGLPNTPPNYHTIQAAVNAANPAGGDTISVAAGTYEEQVVIDKSLTLQGAGDTTIIKPLAGNLTQFSDGLVWSGGTKNIAGIIVADVADGSDVTISNLKVDESDVTTQPSGADYLAGIFYRETAGSVNTVTVVGTGQWAPDSAYGMYLSAGTNPDVAVTVQGSTISNWDKNGIEVMGDELTATILDNTLIGRSPAISGDEVPNGVNVGRDAVGYIISNEITTLDPNPVTWLSAGIMFCGASDCWADSNIINNCKTGIAFDSNGGWATGNTVTGGDLGEVGIAFQNNLGAGDWVVSFEQNTVSGFGDAGISIRSEAGTILDATVENNQLLGGDGNGIDIGGPGGNISATITDNTISGWAHGIYFDSSLIAVIFSVDINSNTITNNVEVDSGIHIETGVNAANVNVNQNNIEDNGNYGVYNGGTGTLDATSNWWGDASGPSGSVADPVTSRIADGTGDAVSGNVHFDPWLRGNPTVTTQVANNITTSSASLNMVYMVGDYSEVQVRFAYKKSTDSAWSYTGIGWVTKTADGTYTEVLTGLTSQTEYDFKAQLNYNSTSIEGNTLTFTTTLIPTVTTQAATDITSYSAIVNMTYTVGNFSSVEVRFACKRPTDQTWFYTTWVTKTENGIYTDELTGLASQTEYEFKAQLNYNSTSIEGAIRRFTTARGAGIGIGDLTSYFGCFIATAAYGTPTAEQIDVLREFRDVVLLKSTAGSQFVALYYRLSPPIADFIARSDLLRTLVRELLIDPIVWIVEATGDIWRN